jgi:hypothetical protein
MHLPKHQHKTLLPNKHHLRGLEYASPRKPFFSQIAPFLRRFAKEHTYV